MQSWVSHFTSLIRNYPYYPAKNLILQSRADRLKTTIPENYPNWSHVPQPCLTQWNYEPCRVGLPKTNGSWWRVLTKHSPLEKGMANHFSILALKTPWTVRKGKKIGHWKMNSHVSRCPICYWRSVEWRDGTKAKTTPSYGCDWWWKSSLMLWRAILHRNLKC